MAVPAHPVHPPRQENYSLLSCCFSRLDTCQDSVDAHKLCDDLAHKNPRGGDHMRYFWDHFRTPLQSLGIDLNELRGGAWVLPASMPTPPSSLPYATRCSHELPTLHYIMQLWSHLASGRDARQQDVVIKVVDDDTMESQIYRTLTTCQELYGAGAFPCVLPPTAIIETPYRFAFVTMPTWGCWYSFDEFETIREVLTFMRSTLIGLSFLHDKRIVHRDIHESNIAINWYCYAEEPEIRAQGMREHRRSASVTYALFDFDCALQLPLETSLRDCRRPSWESGYGKVIYHPGDTWQGELDYNPFAFDVACLGNLFIHHFTEAITVVPLLAPLFAQMTTSIVDKRFAAAEALDFLCKIEEGLSPVTLETCVALRSSRTPVVCPDLYWARLSPEVQRQWDSHRPPPLSWSTRILRWLCDRTIGWRLVSFARRCFAAFNGT